MAVGSGSFTCDGSAPAPGSTGTPSQNLILGGQYQYLRLFADTVSIEDGEFVAQVKVQNLSLQPLATLDGNTAVPSGLRVFFVNEPNNDVVVSNPLGTAPFIASQPSKYFLYEGPDLGDDGILDRGEVSAAKEWRFELNGATEFQFSVLISTHAPAPTAMGVHLTNLAAGYYHTCGEGNDGKVYCWGNSRYGALAAYPSPQFRSLLTPVPAPDGVTLSAPVPGKYRTCAYGSDGFVYCWGITSNGEFGHGENPPYPIIEPVQVPATIAGGVELSGHTAGNDHGCANGDDGAVYCWGSNTYGEVGDGTTIDRGRPTPVKLDHLPGVQLSGVVAASGHTCASGSDGKTYCWGINESGRLGIGSGEDSDWSSYSTIPIPVAATMAP